MSNDFAEGWQPVVDVPLGLKITAIGEREGKYGKYRIYTGERDDGSAIAVHAFHAVLKQELADVQVNDRVQITYLGKRSTKTGDKTFHSYSVVVS